MFSPSSQCSWLAFQVSGQHHPPLVTMLSHPQYAPCLFGAAALRLGFWLCRRAVMTLASVNSRRATQGQVDACFWFPLACFSRAARSTLGYRAIVGALAAAGRSGIVWLSGNPELV
ncbi:hypothetical protein NXS19_009134 [Fusarium pseudograminearum]|nr:hypothetical protein NXS19_009134 [Fusarium pseudograminearum]